jgi:hypothetical protein
MTKLNLKLVKNKIRNMKLNYTEEDINHIIQFAKYNYIYENQESFEYIIQNFCLPLHTNCRYCKGSMMINSLRDHNCSSKNNLKKIM